MALHDQKKLTLFETCGSAIGGMVGGGIFAVLGEAVVTAGNATFISLGLGGVLALITGVVYSKLTVEYDEGGGCFTFIEHILGLQVAGAISWILLTGYICTVGLYAFAFGSYADRLLGYGIGPNPWLASSIIIAIISLLMMQQYTPTHESTDFFIYLKILIIGGIIIIGFFTVKPAHIHLLSDLEHQQVWLGGALIFVIYEGFQILTYRYNIIQNHKKNLPRAIWISISIVVIIYMIIAFILTGSLGPQVIAQNQETAIALLAQPIAGQTGVGTVLLGGLISTSAAIYTTTNATGNLADLIVDDQQLPPQLTEFAWNKTPVIFTILLASGAIALQYFTGLNTITILCSSLFLLVFCVVNFMGYLHHIFFGWKQCFPLIGSAGCIGGLILLLYHSYETTGQALHFVIGIIATILILRVIYTRFHPEYKGAAFRAGEEEKS